MKPFWIYTYWSRTSSGCVHGISPSSIWMLSEESSMLHLLLLVIVSCSLVRNTLGQSEETVQYVRDAYRNSMLATLVDIPFDACEAECHTNMRCDEAVYWRGYHICDLVRNIATTTIPPSVLSKALIFTKYSNKMKTNRMTCDQCTDNQRCIDTAQGNDVPKFNFETSNMYYSIHVYMLKHKLK